MEKETLTQLEQNVITQGLANHFGTENFKATRWLHVPVSIPEPFNTKNGARHILKVIRRSFHGSGITPSNYCLSGYAKVILTFALRPDFDGDEQAVKGRIEAWVLRSILGFIQEEREIGRQKKLMAKRTASVN